MSLGKPESKESALQKKVTESETVGRKQRCTKVVVPTGKRPAAGTTHLPVPSPRGQCPGARRAREEAVKAAAEDGLGGPGRGHRASAGVRKHFPGARKARRGDRAGGGAHARWGGPQGGALRVQREDDGARGAGGTLALSHTGRAPPATDHKSGARLGAEAGRAGRR